MLLLLSVHIHTTLETQAALLIGNVTVVFVRSEVRCRRTKREAEGGLRQKGGEELVTG